MIELPNDLAKWLGFDQFGFLGKFGQKKKQNCQFQLKFGI